MSLFLITIDVVRAFHLDVYEPALASFYLQLITAIGTGMMFRAATPGSIDYSVYQGDGTATPT